MELTLGEIAEKVEARLIGDSEVVIRKVAGIREAGEGDITFLASARYEGFLEQTGASAIILHASAPPLSLPRLVSEEPYLVLAKVLQLFANSSDSPEPGVHPSAIVAPDAELGPGVALGPHVVVAGGARIGADTVIMSGAYVGHRAKIGAGCLLYPRVVVREEVEVGDRVILHPGVVLGSDGFGYVWDGKRHRKVPQVGRVVIEEDVEIGANSTVDRATLGETRIRRGTRIDNLVHIAHNVVVGENSILCAQVGISGSTQLGKNVVLAGQAGLVGHIEIGDGARVGAQGGVTKSVPAGETVSGYPAMNHGRAQRSYAALRQLPEALRTVRELERRLAVAEAALRGRAENALGPQGQGGE